jgi:CheY-like chemotaxis protein
VFWWFEEAGSYLQCETRFVRSDRYEFVTTTPDGLERVEQFTASDAMVERQGALQRQLHAEGWTGPHRMEHLKSMNRVDGALPTRVLVVDDEPGLLTIIERVLRDAGYAVDTASSGVEALEIVAHEGTFALFVIDVMMPEMSGYELARQMRQRHPDVKVLYFTAHADRLLQERHGLGENDALLAKPVTVAGLREAVSSLLFGHSRGLKRASEVLEGPPT